MYQKEIKSNEIYHIYNRGVDRQIIFFTNANKKFFLRRLNQYLVKSGSTLLAYCLMPNHYHLLIKVSGENFSHSVMQPLATSYTKAINKQENRVGPLFQGAFKAKYFSEFDAIIYASKYIHLNPVKANLVTHPLQWEFSSLHEYTGTPQETYVNSNFVLSQFPTKKDYLSFVLNDDFGKFVLDDE